MLELSKQINEDLRTARAIKQRAQENTRPARPDWDQDYVPTREEQGELLFQQIRNLMEDGHSQTLTRAHAREIISMATLILVD